LAVLPLIFTSKRKKADMAEMNTGSKVAIGVGVLLALGGVGVGLYFALRKKDEVPEIPANLRGADNQALLNYLKTQKPNASNAELLKQLGEMLKKAGRTSVGSSSGSGGGGGYGGGKKPAKPQQGKTPQYQQYGKGDTYGEAYQYLNEGQYQQYGEGDTGGGQYNYNYGYGSVGGGGGYNYNYGGYAGGGGGFGGYNYGYAGGGDYYSGYGGYIS